MVSIRFTSEDFKDIMWGRLYFLFKENMWQNLLVSLVFGFLIFVGILGGLDNFWGYFFGIIILLLPAYATCSEWMVKKINFDADVTFHENFIIIRFRNIKMDTSVEWNWVREIDIRKKRIYLLLNDNNPECLTISKDKLSPDELEFFELMKKEFPIVSVSHNKSAMVCNDLTTDEPHKIETKTIVFDFDDFEILEKATEISNNRYNRYGRAYKISKTENEFQYQFTITYNDNFVPYNVFELGENIAQLWMSKYYKIELTGWKKRYDTQLYIGEEYPHGQSFIIEVADNESMEFHPYPGYYHLFGAGMLEYVNDIDYEEIATFSNLTQNPTYNRYKDKYSTIDIKFIIEEGYLFVVKKSPLLSSSIELTLISAFQIKTTDL